MGAPTLAPKDLIEVKADAPIPEKVGGRYTHGDKLAPFNVANATLRHLAAERGGKLGKGKPTANARKAVAELDRRATKRALKAEAKALEADAA